MPHDSAPFVAVSAGPAMAGCHDQMGDLMGDRVTQKVIPVIAGDFEIKAQLGPTVAMPDGLAGGTATKIEAQARLWLVCAPSGTQRGGAVE